MTRTTLKITGMTCTDCAQSISKLFDRKKGIKKTEINYPAGTAIFEYDPSGISKSEIIDTINSTGHYRVTEAVEGETLPHPSTPFDLIVVGGGSAAFSAAIKAEEMGISTLMINDGLDFGGTCVNVGCVPSKFMVRAGESAHRAHHTPFSGIKSKGVNVDFARITASNRDLVSQMQQKKYMDVVSDFEHLTLLTGHATLVNSRTVLVNQSQQYTANKILIATGSKTYIPPIEGLQTTNYLTHQTLFQLKTQPQSMIIIGGGYIALELAQAYHRLGTRITLLQRSEHILSKLEPDVSDELTRHLRHEGITIHTGVDFLGITEQNDNVLVRTKSGGTFKTYRAEQLLLATGTVPNTSGLGLENTGVKLENSGHIIVNNKMETADASVLAAGDVCNTPSYVYTAAFEGKIAIHNAFGNTGQEADYRSLPWVIFTDPQVAGTGIDATEAKGQNIPFETTTLLLKEVPRAITAQDTRGFIKLIRNPVTDRLLGARIVAHEGGELIQLLSMAIKKGITVKELADSLYPYLTLSEGIKLAALSFGKEISKLSCCAG